MITEREEGSEEEKKGKGDAQERLTQPQRSLFSFLSNI